MRSYWKYYPVCSDKNCKSVRSFFDTKEKKAVFVCENCGNRTVHSTDDIPLEALRDLWSDIQEFKKQDEYIKSCVN